MLALNITTPYTGTPTDMSAAAVLARARGGWRISKRMLADDANIAVAVDHNNVVGVFTIRGWQADPDAEDQVVLDLVPNPDWQWLVGQDSPTYWTRSQTRRVRRLGGLGLDELRKQWPLHTTSSDWDLTVAADGTTATLSAPGPIMLTALNNGVLQLRLADQQI